MATMSDLLEFQVVDWQQADVPCEGGRYGLAVTAFGRAHDGTSVAVDILGFRPSFLVLLAGKDDLQAVARDVRTASREHRNAGGPAGEVVKRRDFMFYSPEPKRFLRVDFASLRDYTSARGALMRGRFKDAVYDARLPPFLQLIHRAGVPSAGWIGVPGTTAAAAGGARLTAHWKEVRPVADPPAAMAPLRVAAFDLECWSGDGMFPVPVKGYNKLALDISRHVTDSAATQPPAWAIDLLPDEVCAAFDPDAPGALPKVRTAPPSDLRCTKQVYRDRLAVDVSEALTAKQAAAARIAAVAALLDNAAERGELPRLEGDPIIQIGLTVNTVGSPVSERQIHVWGTCDDVPGADVHVYDSEAAMIEGFADAFRAADPDVVSGYNITGFDFEYLYKRAEALSSGLAASLELGRSTPARSKFAPLYVEKKLTSSALGENDLKYLDMPGRVMVDLMGVVKRDHKLPSYKLDDVAEHFMGERKHAVSPADIFRLHLGGPADRATVAAYCVQDCALCNALAERLATLAGSFGMAEVCRVPASWINLRGQGAKVLSLVADQCARDGFVIPPLGGGERERYDGALVLDPAVGVYTEDPVVVLDYAALYPSSMISNNMSHDTLLRPDAVRPEGLRTHRVDFLKYDPDDPDAPGVPAHAEFVVTDTPGVLPRILTKLLKQRKLTRQRLKASDDPLERGVLDGLQLAFKLSANSLYGQLGAATSPVRCTTIAAATTAVGRSMITKLQRFIEDDFGGEVVYGDTDSCFMTFGKLCVDDVTGERLRGRDAVAKCIELGKACSAAFQVHLPPPQCAEYEKTLWPFILLSRKRYAANKYEFDADAPPSRLTMGVVMARRDNAPIVKDVYGGVLDLILDEQDVVRAARSVTASMEKLASGEVSIDKLVVSKALRGGYVNPSVLPHAALAARMRERDPGSAPNLGDRVPYVFVRTSDRNANQAQRVEHPDYLEAAGAAVDYAQYITHQVMTPVVQIFALAVAQLPGCRLRADQLGDAKRCEAEAKRILFDPVLTRLQREASGNRDIRSMFSRS